MAATLELKYFNSYWLKKLTNVVAESPSAPATPYANVPEAYTPVNATDTKLQGDALSSSKNKFVQHAIKPAGKMYFFVTQKHTVSF